MNNRNIAILFLIFTTNIALARTSKSAICMNDIRQLSLAIEIYKSEAGNPPSRDNWEQELLTTECLYEKEDFIDPWGNRYIYNFPGIHNKESFDIYSLGKDGSSQTGGNDKDDINNWDSEHTWLYEAYGCLTKKQLLCLQLGVILFWISIVSAIVYGIFRIYKKIRKRNN